MRREGLSTISVLGRLRFVATIVFAAAMIAAFAVLRTDEVTLDAAEKMFSTERLEWGPCCNTVIIGDSRAQLGVSPGEIEAILPGSSVRNFGFGSAPLAGPYILRAEELLAPEEPGRIIMCVSPHSLTPEAKRRNAFRIVRKSRERQLALLDEPFAVGPLRPVNLPKVKLRLFGRSENEGPRRWTLYPDGWVAVSDDAPDPEETIPEYREIFAKHQVSAEIVDRLMADVRRWRGKGIRVYGFRMPVTEQMVELEDTDSGMDWEAFIDRFRAAGGVWLDFEMRYESFDGSHLTERAAREFSRDLARGIAEHEASAGESSGAGDPD